MGYVKDRRQYIEQSSYERLYNSRQILYPFIKEFIEVFSEELKQFPNVLNNTFIYFQRSAGKRGLSFLVIKVPLNNTVLTYVFDKNAKNHVKVETLEGNFSNICLSCSMKHVAKLFFEAEEYSKEKNIERLNCIFTFDKFEYEMVNKKFKNENGKQFSINKK